MNDTLLLILIVLMAFTLLILSWATIALLVQARRELPILRQRVDELNLRLARVLEETVPVLQNTSRVLEEAAETIENLHIVSDNVRHKLEVADEVAGKMRRVPEKVARALGRLMHYAFKLGGQLLLRQLQGGRDQRVKPLPRFEYPSPQSDLPLAPTLSPEGKPLTPTLSPEGKPLAPTLSPEGRGSPVIPEGGEDSGEGATSSAPAGAETASQAEANPTTEGRRDDR